MRVRDTPANIASVQPARIEWGDGWADGVRRWREWRYQVHAWRYGRRGGTVKPCRSSATGGVYALRGWGVAGSVRAAGRVPAPACVRARSVAERSAKPAGACVSAGPYECSQMHAAVGQAAWDNRHANCVCLSWAALQHRHPALGGDQRRCAVAVGRPWKMVGACGGRVRGGEGRARASGGEQRRLGSCALLKKAHHRHLHRLRRRPRRLR